MSSSRRIPRGISLSNTVHSDVAPCLPLPSLPVFCGAVDQEIRLSDESNGSRSVNRNVVLNQADKIASLLQETDVSYLWVVFWILRITCLFIVELLYCYMYLCMYVCKACLETLWTVICLLVIWVAWLWEMSTYSNNCKLERGIGFVK